jgi:TetR/AcrR family transcriptional regulator, copper-responsive repressor
MGSMVSPTQACRNWSGHGREQVRTVFKFRDKKDLFVACRRYYPEGQEKRGLLTKQPLGRNNVEAFLKHGPLNKGEQKGCFSVNSMREFAILPHQAHAVVAENRARLQQLLAKNIEVEKPGNFMKVLRSL